MLGYRHPRRRLPILPIDHDWIILGNAPLSDTDRKVAEALRDQMIAKPMLLNEAVTGACEWDDDIASDAESLGVEATDLLGDYVELCLIECKPVTVTHRVLQLLAAIAAAIVIAEREADRRRRFEDAWDYGPSGPYSYGRVA